MLAVFTNKFFLKIAKKFSDDSIHVALYSVHDCNYLFKVY